MSPTDAMSPIQRGACGSHSAKMIGFKELSLRRLPMDTEAVRCSDMEPASSPEDKRPYCEPELVEWGSLVDLTKGPLQHTVTDLDFSGTSQPAS